MILGLGCSAWCHVAVAAPEVLLSKKSLARKDNLGFNSF